MIATLAALVLPALAGAPQDRHPVRAVAPDGSADHRTIQAAVDTAPPGSTIRIAAGRYEERVEIRKATTLEGAGWRDTRLTFAHPKARLDRNMRPTLAITSTRGVSIRGMTICQPGRSGRGGILPGAIVDVDRASVEITDCAIVDCPTNGIRIDGASEVELRRCLVAAVDAVGIAIAGGNAGLAPEVTVVACDVRACHHRGIQIGPGDRSVRILRSRISGSEWHGIRYDDASPTIVGNAIFDNARSGICASGSTGGLVVGNLFVRNVQCGLSCWFDARDRISRNTFARDAHAAIVLRGAARPQVTDNVIHGAPIGVYLGDIGGGAPHSRSTGRVDLRGNVFWQVAAPVTRADADGLHDLPLGVGHGNTITDPGFVDPAADDFAIVAAGADRGGDAGVLRPLSLHSPWPVQPEETVRGGR